MIQTVDCLKTAAAFCLVAFLSSAGFTDSRKLRALYEPDPPPRPSVGPGSGITTVRAPAAAPRSAADPPESPRPAAVGTQFEGMYEDLALDGLLHKPPDVHLGVGTGSGSAGRVIQVTNTGIQIWDKTGAVIAGPISLQSFFGSGTGTTDPRILFDQHSGRFFALCQDGNSTANSNLYVAVSSSSTPGNLTTHWTKMSGSVLTTIGSFGTTWFDYPAIGADSSRLVVTGNMFDGSGIIRGVKIRVFKKSDLIAGTFSSFSDINIDGSTISGVNTVQPAHVFGTTDSGNFYLINRFGTTAYRLWEISGVPPAEITVRQNNTRSWSAGTQLGGIGAPQLGTAVTLDLLSPRVQSAVYRNGIITCCLTSDRVSGDGSQSEIYWCKINTNGGSPSIPTVNQQGAIDGTTANDWAFLPAVTVNAAGDTCIVYTESSSLKYPEVRCAIRAPGDAVGTFQSSVLAKTSAGPYDDFFGDNPERWGDYAAVVVDPTDDTFWMSHEYVRTGATAALNDGRWGTTIFKSQNQTLARVVSFNYDGGLCSWKTGYEVENLGFNLYREEAGQRVRVNETLVAGSALAGAGVNPGRSYAAWDPRGAANAYWLEAIDLGGQTTWHGPFPPTHSPRGPDSLTPSPLLAEIGAAAAKARGPGTALAPTPPAERRVGPPAASGAALAVQQMLASRPAVKISVREEGWYRLTGAELIAAGLDPRVEPRSLRLFADGVEQPCRVTGDRDRRLDPGDTLEFYGLGREAPWTDTRVYWLVAARGAGRRIGAAPAVSARLPLVGTPHTVEFRERTLYFAALHNGEEDNYLGRIIGLRPTELPLVLSHLSPVPLGYAYLEVALRGLTDIPESPRDHQVSVHLNGAFAGQVVFDGRERGTLAARVSPKLLREGENRVELTTREGVLDLSLLETVRLTYWRSLTADGGELRFTAPAGTRVEVDGFSSPGVRLADVTDPGRVQEIPTAPLRHKKGHGATASVPGIPGSERVLLAFSDTRPRRPAALEANVPSAWSRAAGSDYVIVTPDAFRAAFLPLKALHEARGLSVALVAAEDVFDEFGFGEKSPWAIRGFTAAALTRWSRRPRFLLLGGSASSDPRGYVGGAAADLVPTKIVDTRLMETASDDWLADMDGDGVPEMAVGRLPVRSASEAEAVVRKIVGAELAASGRGASRALLIADENDGYSFRESAAELAALVPAGFDVRLLDGGRANAERARQELLAGLASGTSLVNYMGHGFVTTWAHGVFSSADAARPGGALPFVVASTCLNGLIHDFTTVPLGVALVTNPGGGARAVLASSGLCRPEPQVGLNLALYRALFGPGPAPTLGEAVMRAKKEVPDADVRRTFVLIGDPASRLR